jgi:type IV pilus assembly protein PilM
MARTVVGLDIGTSGVRAAEFRLRSRRKPSLRKFATVALPDNAVRRGVVVDQAAVADTLRTLWAQGKFSTKSVVIGIANEGVLVRQMDLDWMPPADFRKALHYQVAEALPVPVDEANLDYHLLEDVEVAGEKEGDTRRINRILLVAAARDVVDGFVTAAQDAGLRVMRADLLPFALIRAASPTSAEGAQAEAIIDIGADTTSVVVHQRGQPRFVRIIPSTGSSTITRALQKQYSWSWEEAERSKIALGMPATAEGGDAGPSMYDHPAQQVITEEAHKLVAEVRATLEFFLGSAAHSETLSKVLLCGAGSRLGGLAELFERELRLPVEMLSPLTGIRAPRRLRLDADRTALLSVSAGLCMGVPAS